MAKTNTHTSRGTITSILNPNSKSITLTVDGSSVAIYATVTYANAVVGDRVLVLAQGTLYYAIGKAF